MKPTRSLTVSSGPIALTHHRKRQVSRSDWLLFIRRDLSERTIADLRLGRSNPKWRRLTNDQYADHMPLTPLATSSLVSFLREGLFAAISILRPNVTARVRGPW